MSIIQYILVGITEYRVRFPDRPCVVRLPDFRKDELIASLSDSTTCNPTTCIWMAADQLPAQLQIGGATVEFHQSDLIEFLPGESR